MNDLKTALNEIQEKIKNFRNYSDDSAREYIAVLKETYQLLKGSQSDEYGRRLSNRMDTAIKALSVEMKDRFDPYFFSMRDKKKQDELNYSKLVVAGVLKRLLRLL